MNPVTQNKESSNKQLRKFYIPLKTQPFVFRMTGFLLCKVWTCWFILLCYIILELFFIYVIWTVCTISTTVYGVIISVVGQHQYPYNIRWFQLTLKSKKYWCTECTQNWRRYQILDFFRTSNCVIHWYFKMGHVSTQCWKLRSEKVPGFQLERRRKDVGSVGKHFNT